MIRTAELADVPRLVEMGCRFIAETCYADEMTAEPEHLGKLARWLIESGGAIFVLELDGALMGMLGVMCIEHPMSGARVASEVFWWVEPEARGQGIRLMKRAERWATEQGAVSMEMKAPNAYVAELYTRLGYHAVETNYARSL